MAVLPSAASSPCLYSGYIFTTFLSLSLFLYLSPSHPLFTVMRRKAFTQKVSKLSVKLSSFHKHTHTHTHTQTHTLKQIHMHTHIYTHTHTRTLPPSPSYCLGSLVFFLFSAVLTVLCPPESGAIFWSKHMHMWIIREGSVIKTG